MNDQKDFPDWIADGEKFALIGLNVSLGRDVSRHEYSNGLTILPSTNFKLPAIWREWLGTTRMEEVEECSLFLLSKSVSCSPSVFDSESLLLNQVVGDWLMGLLLTNSFAALDELVMASGCCINGEIEVRQFSPIQTPRRSIVCGDQPIKMSQIACAIEVAKGLKAVRDLPYPNRWRLLRCLRIYQDTRSKHDILERINQFTRCIEGLIVPKPGKTLRQFKSRTELFVGPNHHDLLGRLYSTRSDIEHLNENLHLESFSRSKRINLAKLEAVSEWIARSCLLRILLDPTLIDHFGNVSALEQFWEKGETFRQEIWGEPINPETPLEGFNFDHVDDHELGASE